MNAKLLTSLLFCAASLVAAEPTKVVGNVIRQKGRIQTGSNSRIELELPYFAVVRVGSNADFKFSEDAKRMLLKSGAMLLSMPQKTEGVSVESGSIVVAMAKGALEMSNVDGAVKVITLDGKVSASLAANSSDSRRLRPGDMVDVPVGATQLPGVVAISLKTLIDSSALMKMGDFPGRKAVEKNAEKQLRPHTFRIGALSPDGGEVAVGLAAVSAQTSAITEREIAVQQLLVQQTADQAAATVQLEAARAASNVQQQQQQQIATEQQRAALAARALAARTLAAVRVAQQRAAQQQAQGQGNQGNQGNAFGPGGNPNNPNNGNQGQGPNRPIFRPPIAVP